MKKTLFLLIIFSLVFFIPVQPSFAAGNTIQYNNFINTLNHALQTVETSFKNTETVLTQSLGNVVAFFSAHSQTGKHTLASIPQSQTTTIDNSHVLATQDTSPGAIPGTSTQGSVSPSPIVFPTMDTAAVNILQNASFEQQTSGQPNNWNYQLDSTTGNTFLSQEGIRSGSYGLKFVGGGTGNFGISQPGTETVPGRTYTFSTYIKYTNAPSFTVRLGFWNDHLNQEGDIKAFTFSGTGDWQRISMTTTTPGLITDTKNEFPLIEVEGLTTGAVYLDDAQLEEGSVLTDFNSAQGYTSSYGIGDGSLLFSTSGDILPAINGTGSLGTATNQFQALNLTNANIDNNGNFTFNGSGTVKGGLTATSLTINGQTLFSSTNSGVLQVNNGGTGQTSFTTNGILYGNGSNGLQVLAPGTSGYVLSTNGSGSAPSWIPASGLSAGSVPFSGITSGTNTSGAFVIGSGSSLSPSGTGTVTANAFSGILGVANGGTGSNNGSITGTSGLVFAAGGSNQNITLTPSGTGFVLLNGNVGIGTSTPFTPLHIEANATDSSQGSSLLVDGTLASGTNSQAGISSQPNVIPGTTSNRTYDGIYSQPYLDTSSLTNGIVEGLNSGVQYNGTGTLGTANGGYFQNVNNSTGTITTSNGLYIDNPINNGTITTNYGLYIANQTAGTTNYAIDSEGGLVKLKSSITPTTGDLNANTISMSVPTAFSSHGAYALDIAASDTVSSGTTNWVTGAKFDYAKYGNSTTNTAMDAWFPFELAGGTGTVSGGASIETQLYLYANATLSSYKGLWVVAPSFNGCSTNCGTVTNLYGLRIDPQKVTGVTNAYGIYQAGASDINFFAGNIQIASDSATTPDLLLGGGSAVTNYLSVSGGRAMFGYDSGTNNMALSAGSGKGLEIFTGGTNGTFLGGTESFLVNSSGNVGIGTTSPTTALDIAGSASMSGNLTFRGGGAQKVNLLNNSSLGFYNSPGGDAGLGTNPALFIANNGSIGVGTNSITGTATFQMNAGGTATADQLTLGNTSTKGFSVRDTGGAIDMFTSGVPLYINNATGQATYLNPGSGSVGVGTSNPLVKLDIRGNTSGTQSVASISGQTAKATLVVNNDGVGDLFTASSSGITAFRIDTNGNITGTGNLAVNGGSITTTQATANIFNTTPTTINLGGNATAINIGASTGSTTINNNLVLNSSSATTTLGGIAYTWPTSGQSNGYVLTTNGSGTLSWTANGGGYWQLNNGALSPTNITNDLLLGGTATSSSTFGFLNVAGGTPTATISSNLSLKVPTGSNPAATFNILNGGSLNFQTATSGQGDAGLSSRLFIGNNGGIGIGTTSVASGVNLQINAGGTANADQLTLGNTSTKGFSVRDTGSGIDMFTSGVPLYINNATGQATYLNPGSGSVGVGTSNPLVKLDIRGNTSGTQSVASISGQTAKATLVVNNDGVGDLITASSSSIPVFKIDTNGNERIGGSLCVKGTLSSACAGSTIGTIYATNTTVQSADVAENYISSQTLEPGDIIMPSGDGNNQAVIKTTSAYQSQTIGIVSTNPGVTLNSDAKVDATHPNLYPIALQGRVPVNVSSQNGNIQAGDLLTSSSIPGVAMKATQAGQIIGKALEAYTAADTHAVGKIMVFVNISWADPAVQITDSGDLSINGQVAGATPQTNSHMLAIDTTPIQSPTSVTTDQFNTLATTVTNLQSQMASQTAQLGKIDDLSKQLADLEKTVNLNQELAASSTQSAVLGASITSEDTTIAGKLSVSGRTLLGDVGITGVVNDGLLTINGMDTSSATPAATINTLSAPLKIQSFATAGVDFMNGKLTVDTSGNLVTTGDITAKTVHADKVQTGSLEINTDNPDAKTVGEASIPAGKTSIEIKTTAITDTSKVFVTSKTDGSGVLYVISQTTGKSFTVKVDKLLDKDVKFNWWILN